MKLDLGKIFFLILFLTLSVMAATAGTVKGTITDRQTKEPLTGATVQVSGTAQGAVADLDGNYTLELKNGTYTLTVRYIGYKDMTMSRTTYRPRTGRPLQHHHAERTAHRLAQPGQQAGAARPVPLVHRTEHHRQQSV